MPSREPIAAFVKMVEAGDYIQAMEAFYAADCTAQENNAPPRVGLPALLAHERCLTQPVVSLHRGQERVGSNAGAGERFG